MIIDFKEIPQANKSNEGQDRFEQFACDFLECIGFEIIRRPDRGPDGKKDLIVSETRVGVNGETKILWLVSCKHYAHSNRAVKDIDEPDIYDRVNRHKCDAFLGFYSTLPSSSLSDKLYGYRGKMESTIFDSTRIERDLLSCKQKERLLASYFPDSNDKYRKNPTIAYRNQKTKANNLTEEDVLRITKTAIILLEIEKIKDEYFDASMHKKKSVLDKLYRFSNHSNEKIAGAIFDFLESAAHLTAVKMPSDIAGLIHSHIFTWFPSSYDNDVSKRIENGKMCIYIGYVLAYDAFIHLNNFKIAEYGLSILKYVYRESEKNKLQVLREKVLEQYQELEQTLNRPERSDLANAKELVEIYKNDLNTKDLMFPSLPKHLTLLTMKDD